MSDHSARSTLHERIAGRKFMLVASTGGHLAELEMVSGLLDVADDSLWVTFDNAQSRSLLSDRSHLFVPYVAPRDLRGTVRAYNLLRSRMRHERFEGVLSTGAAVGVSAMLAGRRTRLPSIYVESLARLDGPSMTGRIVRALPGVETYTQHESWSSATWPFELSIMDSWTPGRRDVRTPTRVFVTIGTISPYRFDRLIEKLRAEIPNGVEVRWQLGDTTTPDLRRASALYDTVEFAETLEWADVVVTHAGVGNILSAMNAGCSTVVVPRRGEHGEHVDNHQLGIATEMARRNLVLLRDASEITWADLKNATSLAPTPAS